MSMLIRRFLVFIALVCGIAPARAQQATVTGIVRDDAGVLVDSALIFDDITGKSTYTSSKGYYMFEVAADRELSLIYYSAGYDPVHRKFTLKDHEVRTIDIKLTRKSFERGEVVVHDDKKRGEAGVTYIDLEKMNEMPSTIGGIEGIIKQLVGSHDELTSQYSVRGGNYDENLVYVNDFEIYRPFLVRSGQQEGLSFVNPDLVSNVNFSVGGFQAKYGDKMSSVLDVTYKRPTKLAASIMISLLGAQLHLEGASKNRKLTYLIGARQKSNQYLLQSQPTKGVYNPSFTDLQALVTYHINDNWELEAIANYARNRFNYIPETQTTNFGELNQAYQLDVYYSGSEADQFDSRFGGISATYHPDSSHLKLKFLASGFQTNEFETYDISGEYLFGQLQTDQSQANFGQIKTYTGTGLVQDFARNYLNVSVGDIGIRGSYDAKKNFLMFGANATITNISDQLHQWERRDSSNFNQPYNADNLYMAYFYNSTADFNYTRISGFVQDNVRFGANGKLSGSFGVRSNYSFLNQELLISPRMQLSYKPTWEKDHVFKFAAGMYAQPPFYREMRDLAGRVNYNLKAQQSAQIVLGDDYNFKMYNRPFKITFETYYKYLWNIDPYIYNNIQIEYTAKNDAMGYVYGGELRLYGDLVKDATSWISIGIMKAAQKITDSSNIRGYNNYFALPSDQRFNLGMYFEDYIPKHKNYKVHLNIIYSTGLPVGPPDGALYQNQFRIPAYKRADIGFSALLLDGKRKNYPAHSMFNGIKSIWGSLEVFNMLAIQNTLSYNWIRDYSSGLTFGVPNYLTGRLLNVKLLFNF